MKKTIIAAFVIMLAGPAFATEDHSKGNDKPSTSAGRPDNRPPSNRPPTHPGKPGKPGGDTVTNTNTSAAGAAAISGSGSLSESNAQTGAITVNVQNTVTAKAGKGGKGGSSGKGGNGYSGGGDNGYAGLPGGAGFLLTPQPVFVNHDYSGTPQQAPAMGNSYISTSNGCDGAQGLGFVFPGGGVNFSSTALRMMCEGRLNSQAHKALGDEDKARKVMRVVDEYACSQDAVWAKIAREEGICKPETAQPATNTNHAFSSAG